MSSSEPATNPCPPLPDGVVIYAVEPNVYCYATYQNLTIGVWVGSATTQSLRNLRGISQHMAERHPEGHSSVVFILDRIPPPDPEARQLLSRAFDRKNDLACVCVVVEGSGFWGSSMRSMIGNAHRDADRQGATMVRVNSKIEEAVAWLPGEHARRTGVLLKPYEFLTALRDVRTSGAALALRP